MDAKTLKEGVKQFKRFHKYAPEKISSVEIPYPKALVLVGDLVSITYRSDKANGPHGRKKTTYEHKAGARVRIYMDPKGKAIYVTGGKFRVTDWLRD